MPKGKGTYGSKVGRPSKKKKYQAGGQVSGNDEAVLEAAQMGQELESIPLGGVEPDFPTTNASDRSESYQLGGAVKSPTAPSMPQYKKGGKVKKREWQKNPKDTKFYAKPKKEYFKGKEARSVPLPKDVSPSNKELWLKKQRNVKKRLKDKSSAKGKK